MDIRVMQEAAVWGAEKAELQKLLRSVQKEVSSSFATIFSDSSTLRVLKIRSYNHILTNNTNAQYLLYFYKLFDDSIKEINKWE